MEEAIVALDVTLALVGSSAFVSDAVLRTPANSKTSIRIRAVFVMIGLVSRKLGIVVNSFGLELNDTGLCHSGWRTIPTLFLRRCTSMVQLETIVRQSTPNASLSVGTLSAITVRIVLIA